MSFCLPSLSTTVFSAVTDLRTAKGSSVPADATPQLPRKPYIPPLDLTTLGEHYGGSEPIPSRQQPSSKPCHVTLALDCSPQLASSCYSVLIQRSLYLLITLPFPLQLWVMTKTFRPRGRSCKPGVKLPSRRTILQAVLNEILKYPNGKDGVARGAFPCLVLSLSFKCLHWVAKYSPIALN